MEAPLVPWSILAVVSFPRYLVYSNTRTVLTSRKSTEDLYIAYPPHHNNSSTTTTSAILYLTDIFGLQLINNRLLADALSKAGYLVVLPDLFRGDPVPADALSNPSSNFNMTAWRARHPQSQVEAIITSALNTTRQHFGAAKVGGVGYCFGGKYIARFLSSSVSSAEEGLNAGFTAHPSNTLPSEWEAISPTRPISIAFGEFDASNTAANRTEIEEIFSRGNKTFQTTLYARAEHGFAVRTNLSDPKLAFAQESAYLQAVRWLDAWLGDD